MAILSMRQFLEAGAHFGHQTRRWNPQMAPYIYGAKNGIHIINLQLTFRMLKEAYEFTRDISARGESVLFVGTKPQAREIIAEESVRAESYYINERWLGGLMTNFNTIKQSVARMKKIEEARGEMGTYEGMIKKEATRMEKQRVKLEKALGGIKEMRRLPGAIFVMDCKKEKIALMEAQKLGIPIIAIVDTNCSPKDVDFVVPGNDDALRSIRLFTATIANAILEGKAIHKAKQREVDEEKAKATKAKKASAQTAADKARPKTDKKEVAAAPQAETKPKAEATEVTEAKAAETKTETKTETVEVKPTLQAPPSAPDPGDKEWVEDMKVKGTKAPVPNAELDAVPEKEVAAPQAEKTEEAKAEAAPVETAPVETAPEEKAAPAEKTEGGEEKA